MKSGNRVFYAAGIYCIVVLHFYLVVRFASFIGNPLEVPRALRGLNKWLRWRMESFVDFIFIVCWLGFVIAFYFLIVYIFKKLPALFVNNENQIVHQNNIKSASKTFWPIITLSLITLCLLPVEIQPKSNSFLEQGVALSFSEFLQQLATATFMIFIAISILGILLLFISIFSNLMGKRSGSGWLFIGLIILSIAISITIGFLGAPYLKFLQAHFDALRYFLILFASYFLLNAMFIYTWKKVK